MSISLRFLIWSHCLTDWRVSALAQALSVAWPPPPPLSLRALAARDAGHRFFGLEVNPPAEPTPARTVVDLDYYLPPGQFLDYGSNGGEGRLRAELRALAQLRDGNLILAAACKVAADAANGSTFVLGWQRAVTQLAVTGANAFAAWSQQRKRDWTAELLAASMPASQVAAASAAIMADFDDAVAELRTPVAPPHQPGTRGWIAVSAEDDPPEFPVNTPRAPYPQFQQILAVSGHALKVRYFIASSDAPGVVNGPFIPPGDEVVLYIHGECSRAEEALDLVPELFAAARAAGRPMTLVALDLPGSGYTMMVNADGALGTPDHLSIQPMPPSDVMGGFIETAPYGGSPLLDFVEATIHAFVEQAVLPLDADVSAVVGGSLGGHMALRVAASGRSWVRNVMAWSPASVMDHTTTLKFDAPVGDQTIQQRWLADPQTEKRSNEVEAPGTRNDFFDKVFDAATFDPADYQWSAIEGIGVVAGLIVLIPPLGLVAPFVEPSLRHAVDRLDDVPPQPQLWYRDGWEGKPTYIQESRYERREVYSANLRRWHWRVCMEMIGFTFDALAPRITAPLQLMVGEVDNYPQVHFLANVAAFSQTLAGPGRVVLVQQTGHSIHNERPRFLADQILQMPRLPRAR